MISTEDVKKLGQLARVDMSEEEAGGLKDDLENILEFVSKLKSAPEGEGKKPATNEIREDLDPHETAEHTEALLGEAPEMEEGYVKVRKIL